MIPSHGFGVWKIGEDEVAPSLAKGSVDSRPSSTVFPQPEKLPPPVLGSGAPTSNKTGAAATLSHAREVETGQRPLSPACDMDMGQSLNAMAHSSLACGSSFGSGLEKAQVSTTLGFPLKPLGLALSKDLGQGSPKCSPCWRRGTPAPAHTIARTPQMEASPLLDASTPAIEPSLPVEARNPQGMLSLPPISLRGESSSSSTPFWDLGLERGRGPCSGLLKSTTREEEATPNPLSMMLKDGSTVVLTEAPSSDPEKDVAKQRDLLAAPPCKEEWLEEELSKLFHFSKVLGMSVEGHEVEILALLKKLRTGSNSLCKRRKKKKSCITRFERELKRLECFVSYGGTSGITKKSDQSSWDLILVD